MFQSIMFFLSYFFLLFRLSVCVVTFCSSNGKKEEILFHIVEVTKISQSIGSIIAVCVCSSLFILLLNNSLLSNAFFLIIYAPPIVSHYKHTYILKRIFCAQVEVLVIILILRIIFSFDRLQYLSDEIKVSIGE